jgi:UDPglucose--hexose-1-phosphate uridylyltransferase
MAKYIPDIRNHRWVILASTRATRPHDKNKPHRVVKKNGFHVSLDCPFCPGNESQTPTEVDVIKLGNNWSVRTFANKFPITDVHEVIVHSPDHLKELPEMTDNEMQQLMIMYQRRLTELEKGGVPIVFRNKGVDAGTSLLHPHSQIIVLPSQVNLETLSLEPIKNKVLEDEHFIAYCPDFSQYPYEVWLAHKSCENIEAGSHLSDSIVFTKFTDEELAALGVLLKKTIRALGKILDGFDYNYYIGPKPPFYLRIIPRIYIRGGFEIGTGLSTNIVDPINAAEEIRKQL